MPRINRLKLYKTQKEYEAETGDRLTSSELARNIFGITDSLYENNSETFNNVISNKLPGNYKARFDERVVMEYGNLDNMDYQGLKSVYKDLKYALKRMDYPLRHNVIDYRSINKEDREDVLRSNIEMLYSSYFQFSEYTMDYSAYGQENLMVDTDFAHHIFDEMKKYEGVPITDTHLENLAILREYYGDDFDKLKVEVHRASAYSEILREIEGRYRYYKTREEEGYEETPVSSIYSDYESIFFIRDMVEHLRKKHPTKIHKSFQQPTEESIKEPRVR